MSAFNYTAKRNLITGHSADNNYDLESGMQSIDVAYSEKANADIALDGSQETLFHRVEEVWSFTTVPLGDDADGDAATYVEFLTSVMSGQTFTIDPYGTTAVADNVQNAKFVPGSYTRHRSNPIQGTANGTWVISFKARVV